MGDMNIVVMGPGGVGKSCIYVHGKFCDTYDPTIEDSYRKRLSIGGREAILEILDTAGTEQFAALRSLYIKNGKGFMLVYSVIHEQSFIDIERFLEALHNERDCSRVPILLVGNKCDMENERVVSTERGKAFADKHNLMFIETSAKTNVNIDQAFMMIVELMGEKGGATKKKTKGKGGGCRIL